MSTWDRGYVTDVAYTMGYYRFQSPAHLHAACLLCGVATDLAARREHLHYMELGCGHGFGAVVLAASNPDWRVTGIDFNPAHVASARRLARDAGIDNATFIEADLTGFAEGAAASALPEVDVVSAHGVWSWVPAGVRDGIVRLLGAKLRAGGVAHLSYNSLPGWQGGMGLQRLMREAGRRDGGRSDRQAQVGLQAAHALLAADARHLTGTFPRSLLEKIGSAAAAYLAHEFMNDAWSPCFHADVAAAMAGGKLGWVGSASLMENFPALTLTDEQRVIYEQLDDPVMRELVKDMCVGRQLRHDIYVRGPSRMTEAARDAALSDVTVALCVTPDRFAYEAELPPGNAALNRAFYEPVVRALAEGPRSIGELLSLPAHAAPGKNPAELLGMLVGTDQAIVVARPGAAQGEAAARLNRLLAARHGNLERGTWGAALASTRLGAGLPASPLDLFAADRLACGEGCDADAVDRWVAALAPGADAAGRDELRAALSRTPERAVVWRAAGTLG